MRAALACVLLLAGACGADGTLITVSVSGRPPEAQLLRAAVSLGGKQVQEEVKSSLDEFGLLLPSGASGFIDIRLDAVGADGTLVGRGCTNTTLMGRSSERLKVELYRLPDSRDPCQSAAK